jgi:predicted DNA binding protein
MQDWVVAELEVFGPASCQLVPLVDGDGRISDVSQSRLAGDDDSTVEEFTVAADGGSVAVNETDAAERLFDRGDGDADRLSRPTDNDCVGERIERAGCLVQSVEVTAESLVLTFRVDDEATLRRVIGDLRETAESVSLRRLVQRDPDTGTSQPVVFDRDDLTDRQLEVLERADEMGYFEYPREANAGEVADALEITTATFTEHLAAAQRKVFDDLLPDR